MEVVVMSTNKVKDFGWGLFLGIILGLTLFSWIIAPLAGVNPDEYSRVLKPVAEARGFSNLGEIIDTKEAEKLLNPCVVDSLPQECLKYVVNGVVTQPPIKIVVDLDPPKRDPR
jgi:hypothetical protein